MHKVGVAKAKLAVCTSILGDAFCWIFAVAHKDFLCSEHNFYSVFECFDVERVVFAEILKKVNACEVTCRVVVCHLLMVVSN